MPSTIRTTSTTECRVLLETASFTKKEPWEIRLGEQSLPVKITDRDFLRQVGRGEIRFGKGDTLLIRLKTTRTLCEGLPVETYAIPKVLQHQTSSGVLSQF